MLLDLHILAASHSGPPDGEAALYWVADMQGNPLSIIQRLNCLQG